MRNKLLVLGLCACIGKPPAIPTPENTYTKEELNLIYRVVETETYTADVESKSHVASVIFNMINDEEERFGQSVTAVIRKKNRFVYSRKKISKSTKKAVKKAFYNNTAPGCYAFHSGKKTKRFAGFKYSFTDEVGHHFYEEVK